MRGLSPPDRRIKTRKIHLTLDQSNHEGTTSLNELTSWDVVAKFESNTGNSCCGVGSEEPCHRKHATWAIKGCHRAPLADLAFNATDFLVRDDEKKRRMICLTDGAEVNNNTMLQAVGPVRLFSTLGCSYPAALRIAASMFPQQTNKTCFFSEFLCYWSVQNTTKTRANPQNTSRSLSEFPTFTMQTEFFRRGVDKKLGKVPKTRQCVLSTRNSEFIRLAQEKILTNCPNNHVTRATKKTGDLGTHVTKAKSLTVGRQLIPRRWLTLVLVWLISVGGICGRGMQSDQGWC